MSHPMKQPLKNHPGGTADSDQSTLRIGDWSRRVFIQESTSGGDPGVSCAGTKLKVSVSTCVSNFMADPPKDVAVEADQRESSVVPRVQNRPPPPRMPAPEPAKPSVEISFQKGLSGTSSKHPPRRANFGPAETKAPEWGFVDAEAGIAGAPPPPVRTRCVGPFVPGLSDVLLRTNFGIPGVCKDASASGYSLIATPEDLTLSLLRFS